MIMAPAAPLLLVVCMVTLLPGSQPWSLAKLTLLNPCPRHHMCVKLDECQRLAVDLLRAEPTDARTLLKNTACQVDHSVLGVCCPVSQALVRSVPDGDINLEVDHPKLHLLNPEECGRIKIHTVSRITGGSNATIGEFPWMVILMYKIGGEGVAHRMDCGGSLITNRWVLTAAHCLKYRKKKKLVSRPLKRVRLGEFDASQGRDCDRDRSSNRRICTDPPIEIEVQKMVPHPQYQGRYRSLHENDIGLVYLKKTVGFSDSIVPICLPLHRDLRERITWIASMPLVISGWGLTVEHEIGVHPVLQKLRVHYLTPFECEEKLSTWKQKVQKTQVCAEGREGSNACSGDSGGPLTAEEYDKKGSKLHYQLGIVSFGYGHCQLNPIAVYTKVEPYIRWILDTIF